VVWGLNPPPRNSPTLEKWERKEGDGEEREMRGDRKETGGERGRKEREKEACFELSRD